MDLPPDALINNRYRIQRKLGQGGMGVVYLARDLALDRDVALKAGLRPDSEREGQFLREARLLAGLRHPSLPRVTDYFILGGVQYLVMDYIPGRDLDSLLAERGRLPLAEVLAIARQLGGALAYMHRQDPPVIHRDVKPGNIRLTAEGEAVLVDFGIARVGSPGEGGEAARRAYTAGFAPPEQYGGLEIGPRADQYALAATLYTLLGGQKPPDAIRRALQQAELAPLSDVPSEVQSAIERALAVRPEERFESIEAFLAALECEPARTAAPLPQAAPPKAIRRGKSPWLLFGAGLLGLALLALGAVWFGGRGKAPAALPSAAMKPFTATATAAPTIGVAAHVTPTEPRLSEAAPSPGATETAAPTPTFLPLGGGGEIAFSSDRAGGGVLQIWTLRAVFNDQGLVETGDYRQVTFGAGDKTWPRWSPDGRWLLYVAPGEAGNGLEIWRAAADGSSEPVNLSRRKGDDTEPAWSPDGRLIAFTNNGREDGVRQLYLMNADGSGQVRLSFDQEEFGAAWSPDMRFLAFVMNASGFQILNLREQQSLPAAPGPFYVTPQRFDYSTLTGSLGQVAHPDWSPDGGWVAYTRQEGARGRIFLARFPLRSPELDVVKLTDPGSDWGPAWSPDSQWLAFTSARDGDPEVYVMRANGQGETNLTHSPGRDQDPDWKP